MEIPFEKSVENLYPFITMPKAELHAHLNGSLSPNTLEKLKILKKEKTSKTNEDLSGINLSSSNLSECFKLFGLIHELTDNPEAIYIATCDVIKDFCEDGVYYLELRTTPKEGNFMDQSTYIETVLKAINATVSELNHEINVKLILSLDRKRPTISAEETIKIAENYYTSSQTVVGIDLSGDPTVGNIKDFIPLLEHAKKVGLKLAIHTAEVSNCEEEVAKLLKLEPHRLGHGTFLHPSKGGSHENFKILKELKIPLEICLTSNIICKTVPSYEEHHFVLLKGMNYPCVLCTDDKGVFNTSLSQEYFLASQYYSLSEETLFDLSYKSLDYIFATTNERQQLQKLWISKFDKEYSFTDCLTNSS